jgi:hypothetical protein
MADGPDEASFYLKNLGTGLCLSPAGGSTGLNVTVVQYTCDQDQSRLWELGLSGGAYTFINVKSNLCLSPAGGGTALNTPIVQYTCDGDPARVWTVFKAYQIRNSNSGGLCLTVAGGSTVRNTVAVQYTCDRDPARLWNLSYFNYPHDDTSLYLQNVNSGLCLSPAGGATGLNTLVVQYYCDSDAVRAWRLLPDGTGHAEIQNIKSGLCLSPAAGSTGLSAAVVLYSCDADPSRLWQTGVV